MLRAINVRNTTESCGTANIWILTVDAWWYNEIRVVINEKKQAYLRKWNTTGHNDDKRISLENDHE